MFKQIQDSSGIKIKIPGFGKGILVALGFTFLVFFLAALLLTYTRLTENAIPFISTVTLVVSVMIAGGVSAKAGKNRGFINGGLTGVCYAFLLYFVSLLISGSFFVSGYLLVLLAVGLFGGAFGGILGINLKGKRKRY